MSKTNRAALNWTTVAVIAVSALAVQADDITINNLTLPNVRVTSIADGMVEYISAGARRSSKLEDVTAIDFSRYPGYAEAMGKLDSDPKAAADIFRDLASDVREDFLIPWMRLRAAQALDKAGQFRDALDLYLEAVEGDDSDYFVSRAPSNVGTGQAAKRARQALTQAIGRTRDADVKAALRKVLASAQPADAEPADDDPADPVTPPRDVTTVTPPADTGPQPDPEPRERIDPAPASVPTPADGVIRLNSLENLLDNDRYDQALEQIDNYFDQPAAVRMRAELYYYRGRAQSGQKRHFAAALSLLRVPVHYPDHALAVTALELAGHELKADGQADAARTVWENAVRKTDDTATKRRLMEAINSL